MIRPTQSYNNMFSNRHETNFRSETRRILKRNQRWKGWFNIRHIRVFSWIITIPEFHRQLICVSARRRLSFSYHMTQQSCDDCRVRVSVPWSRSCVLTRIMKRHPIKRTSIYLSNSTKFQCPRVPVPACYHQIERYFDPLRRMEELKFQIAPVTVSRTWPRFATNKLCSNGRIRDCRPYLHLTSQMKKLDSRATRRRASIYQCCIPPSAEYRWLGEDWTVFESL